MSDRLPVKAGQSSRLRVQFTDAAGDPIEATSVTVDLFDPDQDTDTDTPVVEDLVPVFLGNGIFEVTFTAPTTPDGTWRDRWTGTIFDTETTTLFSFELVNTGAIISYPVQGLRENTLVEVLLTTDITSSTGTALEEEINFFYTTTLTPFYSSARKVRLDSGGLLGTISDYAISLAILEASIEADIMTFAPTNVNNNMFVHARRQYVTCLAAQMLAGNVLANGGVLKSKSLSDFKVEYDTGIIANLLNRLEDCLTKWSPQLQTGGGARAIGRPQMVIKGELDPDRPTIGRLWYGIAPGEQPFGNNKYRTVNSRRWRTGWVKRNRGSTW